MSATAHRVTFGGLVRSEWIKLFSLRATWWLTTITVVLFAGVAALSALASGPWDSSYINPETRETLGGDPSGTVPPLLLTAEVNQELVRWSAPLLLFAALVISVLGALSMAGEFGTGMIKSTFAAAPRRTGALLSKLLTVFLASLLVGAIGAAIGTAASAAILSSFGWPIDLADPYLWRALGGTAAYIGFAGAFGVLVGAIIRVQAGAIPTVIGILLVLPTILSLLSALLSWDWLSNVAPFLPNSLGSSLSAYSVAEAAQGAGGTAAGIEPPSLWLDATEVTSATPDGETLVTRLTVGAALAGLLLLAWLLVTWIFAQLLTKRRDV